MAQTRGRARGTRGTATGNSNIQAASNTTIGSDLNRMGPTQFPISVGRNGASIKVLFGEPVASTDILKTKLIKDLEDDKDCGRITVENEGGTFEIFKSAGSNLLNSTMIPGMVYNLEDVQDQSSFNVVDEPRNGLQMTNYVATTSNVSENINNPHSYANLVQGLSNLRNGVQVFSGSPTLKVHEVYTKEDLYMAIGGGMTCPYGSVSADLNFQTNDEKYKYLLEFTEEWYTINAQMNPNKPIFKDESFVPGAKMAYVSAVTYGRRLFVLIETSASLQKFDVDVEAEIKAGMMTGHMNASYGFENSVQTGTATMFAIGGTNPSKNALLAALSDLSNMEAISAAIQDYFTTGAGNPATAEPVGYQLKDLNGVPVVTQIDPYTTTVRVCNEPMGSFTAHLKSIKVNEGEKPNKDDEELKFCGYTWIKAFDNGVEIPDEDGINATGANSKNWFADDSNPLFVDQGETVTYDKGLKEKAGTKTFDFSQASDEAEIRLSVQHIDFKGNTNGQTDYVAFLKMIVDLEDFRNHGTMTKDVVIRYGDAKLTYTFEISSDQ